MLQELVDRETDILRDLTKQDRRDVASGVDRDGGRAAVGVSELLVRAALAHFDEAEPREDRDDLARLKNRDARHSFDDDGLRADEFGLELRFAVLEQHRNHFAKIRVQLIERRSLAVRSRESRYVAHVEARIRAVLDNGGKSGHGANSSRESGGPRKGSSSAP